MQLYDVPQVGSALLGIHARVCPLVFLLVGLGPGPRFISLQSKALALLSEPMDRTTYMETKFDAGKTARHPKGLVLRVSCHPEVARPLRSTHLLRGASPTRDVTPATYASS